jgi:hypothetical protein
MDIDPRKPSVIGPKRQATTLANGASELFHHVWALRLLRNPG